MTKLLVNIAVVSSLLRGGLYKILRKENILPNWCMGPIGAVHNAQVLKEAARCELGSF